MTRPTWSRNRWTPGSTGISPGRGRYVDGSATGVTPRQGAPSRPGAVRRRVGHGFTLGAGSDSRSSGRPVCDVHPHAGGVGYFSDMSETYRPNRRIGTRLLRHVRVVATRPAPAAPAGQAM